MATDEKGQGETATAEQDAQDHQDGHTAVDWTRIDALIAEWGSGPETFSQMTAEEVVEALLDRGRLDFPKETTGIMRARAVAAELAIKTNFEGAEEAKLLRFIVERAAEETEDAVGCPASENHPRLAEICQPEREKWPDDTEEEQDRWDEHCGPCREKGVTCWMNIWLLEAEEALAELDKQAKEWTIDR